MILKGAVGISVRGQADEQYKINISHFERTWANQTNNCNGGTYIPHSYLLRLQVSRDRESWALEFQSWSWRVQSCLGVV